MKQQSFEILKRGFEFGTTDLDKETESLKISELQNFIKGMEADSVRANQV